MSLSMGEPIRQFGSGATRSPDDGRDDPEGYLSPLVINRFNQYMTKHCIQTDGSVRASDNWQKGMPLSSYMKGMWRHMLHLWQRHRGWPVTDLKAALNKEEDLCAIIFNAQGYLHEVLKEKYAQASLAKEVASMSRLHPQTGEAPRTVIPPERYR